MNVVNRDYESQMIEMAINKYLDETISVTEEDLKRLRDNRDQTVWDLTARIYVEIGYKVKLITVRDIVNDRIEAIKCQLDRHQHPAIEATYPVIQQQCKAEIDLQDMEEDVDFHSKVTSALGKFGGDKNKAKVFVRVRKVISYCLEVDESMINSDCHMSNHLNMDELDLTQILLQLEEEFDIELPDESVDFCSLGGNFNWSSCSGTSSSYSSFRAGEECTVRNFVELVYKIILNSYSLPAERV